MLWLGEKQWHVGREMAGRKQGVVRKVHVERKRSEVLEWRKDGEVGFY